MNLKVARKRCDQCLFSENKIVSEARKEELLECVKKGLYFVCHKFSIAVDDTVGCRGFYDVCPSQAQQVLGCLGMVDFVELPETPLL